MPYIDLSYNFTNVTDDVIIVIYDNSNPLTEVDRFVLDDLTPATAKQGNHVFSNGILPVVYQVKSYSSTDGVALDASLGVDLFVDAAYDNALMLAKYMYVVDRGLSETDPTKPFWADPASGQPVIVDERLIGATYETLDIEERGMGSLTPDEFTILSTGGIQLTVNEFSNGNVYFARFQQKQVTVTTPTGGSGGGTADEAIQIITTTQDFAPGTWRNKRNIGQFPTIIGVTNFPDFDLIPNGTRSVFCTFGGNQRYWTLQFATGDSVFFAGRARNTIHLGVNELIELYWYTDGGVKKCQVLNYVPSAGSGYGVVGQVTNGSDQLLGTFAIPGTDTDFDMAEFIRLIEEVPISQKVGYFTWDNSTTVNIYGTLYTYYPNRGKFAVDEVNGTFRFPDINGMVIKFVDGNDGENRFSAGAGSIQANELLNHGHNILAGTGGSSTNTPDPGQGLSGMDGNTGYRGDEGDFVSAPNRILVQRQGGNKNIVDNFGQLALIRL